LIFDKSGNLYGETSQGGNANCPPAQCGIVFEVSPPSRNGGPWTEQVLYIFKGHDYGDGSSPSGGFVSDAAGNLYGTTAYGGSGGCILSGTPVGCGTVFKMTPPSKPGGSWTESVIYSFMGGNDGYLPTAGVVFAKDGNLYGSTYYGGGFGSCNAPYYQYCGTIFKLIPAKKKDGKWTEKVLYSFKASNDGANPNGNLVFDAHGTLYGTTFYGGSQGCQYDNGTGCGTVFSLSPPTSKGRTWTEQILHRFQSAPVDGRNPEAGVIFDHNGSLLGTTLGGGDKSTSHGTAFELQSSGNPGRPWTESLLHVFSGSGNYPCCPMSGLVLKGTGTLYGTTSGGGSGVVGIVFRLQQSNGRAPKFEVLHDFSGSPDGAYPQAELIFDKQGNLYSTTPYGGTGQCGTLGCGTVFELSP
jgi:hypothetical protein